MVKITVIIPVYKVGKYIENSMKSVLSQTYKDFEVLLVDNNTPDDSIEIAEEMLKPSGIEYRVIQQTIQGLPAARNMGIVEAKSKWCVSIDPDDTISKYFLEELYNNAIKNNLDVVFSEYGDVKDDSLFVFPEENKENALEILDRDFVMKQLLTRKLPLMVSNMFFNREFFLKNNLHFDQNVILGADLLFLWTLLLNVEKVGHLDKKLYNHYSREGSLMTTPSLEKIASNLKGYEGTCKHMAEVYSKDFSQWVYSRELFALLSGVSIYGNYTLFYTVYKKYYNNEIHKSLNSFQDHRIVILNKLLFVSPYIFYKVNRNLRKPHSIVSKLLHNQ